MNYYLQAKSINYTDIYMAQKLKSRRITINKANKMETKKGVKKKSRTAILGKKVCIVTKTFRVIAHFVFIDSINMKENKIVIEQIGSKNVDSISDLNIK